MRLTDLNGEVILKKWYDYVKLALRDRYITGENLDNVFLRTGMHDIKVDLTQSDAMQRLGRASHDITVDYPRGMRILFNYKDTPSIADLQSQAFTLALSMAGRRFFLTQRGYLGLGPASMQVDDAIYMLGGGLWPPLLRTPKDLPSFVLPDGSDTQPLRTLVGDCYVHGIMDGEFAKDHKTDVSPVYLI